jgi:hypothetical protein
VEVAILIFFIESLLLEVGSIDSRGAYFGRSFVELYRSLFEYFPVDIYEKTLIVSDAVG